ncbi:hypothetical protein OKA04_15010 [Luteolibacter flavescens]|uniref:Uncharacterized protein n=1 Tax=Luteolibacter flavescens TaxID=1859460 RepID=A0ABT3FR36_9BACT|nr:hypothetical protein [Luteolibacter flavescens]MCW1886046.1 hypothetical protein [Luteolibacter flavescens]
MKHHPRTRRRRLRHARGFTLIDTSMAIGLMAVMVLPILGLLTVGTVEAGRARGLRETAGLRDELRLRLQDRSWPEESQGGREWRASVDFDRKCRLIAGEDMIPWVKVELEGMAAPGFQSERFEAVKIRITAARSGKLLDEAVVQRVKGS